MKNISTPKFSSQFTRWPIWVIAITVTVSLLLGWHKMREAIDESAHESFDTIVRHESEVLTTRMHDYERVLYGASGLFLASASVNRHEWRAYFEALHLDRSLPGIQGLGYSILFPQDELSAQEKAVQKEGFPEFSVYPKGERDTYSAIIFIEPFENRNLHAFGYDMYSEPTRNIAMKRAMRTGLPAWSGKVTLVQEIDNNVQAGFLVYLPIFKKGHSVRSETERVNAIQGFVYSAFRAEDMMTNLFKDEGRLFDIHLYDASVSPENLLFQTQENHRPSKFSKSQIINIGGTDWVAVFTSNKLFENTKNYTIANLFLATGLILLGLTLFGVVLDSRKRAQLTITNQTLKNSIEEAHVLAKITELLQNSSTLDEAFSIISTGMPNLFPNSSGSCYTIDEPTNSLLKKCSWGDDIGMVSSFSPNECWGIKRSMLHCSDGNSSLEIQCQHLKNADHSHVCIPLLSQGKLLGTLSLIPSAENRTGLSDQRYELFASAGEIVSLTLANLQLRETLQQLSVQDPLTGLYNRRFMEENLDREIARARRKNSVLAMAMIDLDHFKNINDTYGHEVGDIALKKTAKLLASFRDGSDFAARYGGEEFLLVLTDINQEMALKRLETLRNAIAEMTIEHDGKTICDITASIGVAIYPDHGDTPAELVRHADASLYDAKSWGRNQIVL